MQTMNGHTYIINPNNPKLPRKTTASLTSAFGCPIPTSVQTARNSVGVSRMNRSLKSREDFDWGPFGGHHLGGMYVPTDHFGGVARGRCLSTRLEGTWKIYFVFRTWARDLLLEKGGKMREMPLPPQMKPFTPPTSLAWWEIPLVWSAMSDTRQPRTSRFSGPGHAPQGRGHWQYLSNFAVGLAMHRKTMALLLLLLRALMN
ncbi:hypothetical protein [Marinobacter adhaerens]|uniref:hypothetical protein n=1 Tax=Marinobacter adhaerens TaxID=1033846 RepID=UPI003D0E4035